MKRTICLLLSALLLLALCGCGEQERGETKDIQDSNAVSDIEKQPESSPVTYTKEYSNHSITIEAISGICPTLDEVQVGVQNGIISPTGITILTKNETEDYVLHYYEDAFSLSELNSDGAWHETALIDAGAPKGDSLNTNPGRKGSYNITWEQTLSEGTYRLRKRFGLIPHDIFSSEEPVPAKAAGEFYITVEFQIVPEVPFTGVKAYSDAVTSIIWMEGPYSMEDQIPVSVKDGTLSDKGMTLQITNNTGEYALIFSGKGGYNFMKLLPATDFGTGEPDFGGWDYLEPFEDVMLEPDDSCILPGETPELAINWEKVYGELPLGTYMLKKIFYVVPEAEAISDKSLEEKKFGYFFLHVEFTIYEEGTEPEIPSTTDNYHTDDETVDLPTATEYGDVKNITIEPIFGVELTTDDIRVAAEPGTLSNTGLSFKITNNTEDYLLEHDESYGIQKYENGEWADAPALVDGFLVTLIAYSISPGSTGTTEIDWEHWYGELPQGTYRIVKSFDIIPDGYIDPNIPYYERIIGTFDLYIEFEIIS